MANLYQKNFNPKLLKMETYWLINNNKTHMWCIAANGKVIAKMTLIRMKGKGHYLLNLKELPSQILK